MDLEKSFGVDDELAEQGKWFEAGPEARLKIASVKNEDFLNYVREHSVSEEQIVTDDDSDEDFGLHAVAKYLLKDWENVKVDGEEVDYSVEKAKELFQEYPEFADLVLRKARNNQNFQDDEETKENLSNGSDGN